MEKSGFLPPGTGRSVRPRTSPPQTGAPATFSLHPSTLTTACLAEVAVLTLWLSFPAFYLPKFPINQSPHPVYSPSSPLGHHYSTTSTRGCGGRGFRVVIGLCGAEVSSLVWDSGSRAESDLFPTLSPFGAVQPTGSPKITGPGALSFPLGPYPSHTPSYDSLEILTSSQFSQESIQRQAIGLNFF